MKKGDLRKQEILQTAEMLFCRYGYEKTSVQDIIDELNTSKGSFYHHYISKESLLEAIFLAHAGEALPALDKSTDIPAQIDLYLSSVIPFRNQQLSFLMMLLNVFRLPEGKTMKTAYCDALEKVFLPSLSESVLHGNQKGILISADPEAHASLCLCMTNRLWIQICDFILNNEQKGTLTDPGEILHMTGLYRNAIERILFLPYGCLSLLDIPSICLLTERIHSHWKP